MGMNSFIRGMHTVNPNGKIKLVWINEWYDPGKRRGQGTDRPGRRHHRPARRFPQAPLQVKRVCMVWPGLRHDQFAPKAQLTSSIDHWDDLHPAYGGRPWMAAGSGRACRNMLKMAPYTNMPDDAVKAAQDAEDGAGVGKIVILRAIEPIRTANPR